MKRLALTAAAGVLGMLASAGGAVAEVNIQHNGAATYTTVLGGGSTSAGKYNIVFLGDGFTAGEQAAFDARVNDAVAALQALPPYAGHMCAFNVFRVNVVSAESGVDHPASMPPVERDTELGVRYGNPANNEAQRCITSSDPAAIHEAAAFAPDADAIFVLANDSEWGGCAGGLVFSSISPGFAGIITHELGHKIGGLADEYDCYKCDGTDNDRTYVGAEVDAVNLTAISDRATTKWASLIDPSTPLPTTVDSPPGVVGLWEGGGYHRFGIFRPRNQCHMRDLAPFCPVCAGQMTADLASHCSTCELYPGSLLCYLSSIGWGRLYLHAWLPFRINLPFPPCLSCPDFKLKDEWRYQVRGLPEKTRVIVF